MHKFGDDPPRDVEKVLSEGFAEALDKDLSNEVEVGLKILIQKQTSMFMLRFGSGEPARVTSMKIRLH